MQVTCLATVLTDTVVVSSEEVHICKIITLELDLLLWNCHEGRLVGGHTDAKPLYQ